MFFRVLSDDEANEFREWVRANWEPGKECSPAYHPVVREEWARLDLAYHDTTARAPVEA